MGKVNYNDAVYIYKGLVINKDYHKLGTANDKFVSYAENPLNAATIYYGNTEVKQGVGLRLTGYALPYGHGIHGVQSVIHDYSQSNMGSTAFYGTTYSTPSSNYVFALHGENRHGGGISIGLNIEFTSYTTEGKGYGAVFNRTKGGGQQEHFDTGQPVTYKDDVHGIFFTGQKGEGWRDGLYFAPYSINTDGIAIDFRGNCSTVLDTSKSSMSGTDKPIIKLKEWQAIDLGGGAFIQAANGEIYLYSVSGVICITHQGSIAFVDGLPTKNNAKVNELYADKKGYVRIKKG